MEGAKEKWYKFVFLLTFFDPYFNLFLLYVQALNRILFVFKTLQMFFIASLLYPLFSAVCSRLFCILINFARLLLGLIYVGSTRGSQVRSIFTFTSPSNMSFCMHCPWPAYRNHSHLGMVQKIFLSFMNHTDCPCISELNIKDKPVIIMIMRD